MEEKKIKQLQKELDSLKNEFDSLREILLNQYDKWVDIEKKYHIKLEEYNNLINEGHTKTEG